MLKFVDSQKIDKKRWDEIIANSPKNNCACYSWFLDATTEKWGALMTEDYSFVLPLPYKNRVFYKKMFQHPFGRNLEFFGDEKYLSQVAPMLKKLGYFNFHFNHKLPFDFVDRVYQKLDLKGEIKYRANARRILKKFKDKYTYEVSSNWESVTKLYFANSFYKIKQQEKNKVFVQQVMQSALKHNNGEVVEVFNEDKECIAAAFFFKDKETITYLIGDSTMESKKEGSMYCLMDFAIHHYQPDFKTFDFGGSNVESVSSFYKKLGGEDMAYFGYKRGIR